MLYFLLVFWMYEVTGPSALGQICIILSFLLKWQNKVGLAMFIKLCNDDLLMPRETEALME